MKADGKNKPLTHIETDLDEGFVAENIIKPYTKNEIIFVDGSRVDAENIQKIAVFNSEEESKILLKEESLRAKMASKREKANRIFSGTSKKSLLLNVLKTDSCTDITRRVFNQALGL
jgi:hypothetical protein